MRKAVELADQFLEQEIGRNIHELRSSPPTAPRPNANKSDDGLATLFRQMTDVSMREIDILIDELRGLRKKLETDSNLIERAIAQHSQFSQGAMQLTTMLAANVRRLPQPSS